MKSFISGSFQPLPNTAPWGCDGARRTALRAALPAEAGEERVGDASERIVHADAVHGFYARRLHVRQRAAPAHAHAASAAGLHLRLKPSAGYRSTGQRMSMLMAGRSALT